MRHRGRRTPPHYMRGTGDYDNYRKPMTYEEREREERIGCLLGIVIFGSLIVLGIWFNGGQ